MIAVSEPVIGELEEELVLEALRSGQLTQGPMVERFEAAVANVTGARHVVAVNSGTSALLAALLAHDIGPGDEVIISPFTFVATLNTILLVGATPRFVDIGDDFAIDPGHLEEAITERTRAMVPVHLYGLAADMQGLRQRIGDRPIVIIEDAAQALGGTDGERRIGESGTACFSFYATKNVTTGEGGVVTAATDEVGETLRYLRNQGQRGQYDYARPGLNLRMTDLQGALGVAQMLRLPSILAARRHHAQQFTERLAGIEGLVLPVEPPDGRHHVFHQYTVRVAPGAHVSRDELADRLRARGIGCAVYYPRPVHEYPCFQRDPRVGVQPMPVARQVSSEVLSLPIHPGLTPEDVDHVVAAVRHIMGAQVTT